MTCPHCGGTNFEWAPTCDHCGRPIDDRGPASPVAVPFSDPAPVTVDPATLRQQQFMRALMAGTPRLFGTFTLIGMNVAVFVAMVASGVPAISPPSDSLLRWGADYAPLATHGQWWRLFTAMFVHIGLIHLVMNMLVLFSIGTITERLFGNVGFVVLYVGAGIAGSFTSLLWHPLAVGAGASGAVFGLYGGLFGFLLIRRASIPADEIALLAKSGLYFVVANLLYGVTQKEVDVSAHLGGFVFGIALGCALAVPLAADFTARLQRSALVALSCAALAGLVAARMPTVDDWAAEIKRLAALERDSARLYDGALDQVRARTMTREEFARVVDAKLLPPWDTERATFTSLRIPEPQRSTARAIANYMALMAKAWRLTAEGMRTNDGAMIRNGSLQVEAALVAWQAAMPDKDITSRLGQLRSTRATADAFAAEVDRIAAAEKDAIKALNDSLARLKASQINRDQFADAIATRVLRPWNAERERLSALKAPEGQDAAAKQIAAYMSLRGEGWLLTARAVQSNDPGLLRKAVAKQAEASNIAKTIRESRGP
jgi:membrane associated rhomboid family serine protease